MDYEQIFGALGVYNHLTAFLLGTPRLFMIVQILPFMAGSILTGQLRVVLVFALYLVLHPYLMAQLPHNQIVNLSLIWRYMALIIKEGFIGFIIGYLGGILFWMIEGVGLFIDNQRGAAMAAQTDPLSGNQTSPLGSFLFQSLVYLFFSSSTFILFLDLIYKTYEFWPVHQAFPLNWKIHVPEVFAQQVDWLMNYMMLLSGPIAVSCLLTDISLGLINRFASQLNVYILAMPIKSAVAAFLLLFYFSLLLEKGTILYSQFGDSLSQLRRALP